MCKAFSPWQRINRAKSAHPEKFDAEKESGRKHLEFVRRLYEIQDQAGRLFLHEHPLEASSWDEECIQKIMALPGIEYVDMDQCQYGLLTPSDADRSKLVPALKPTKWLTNSQVMSEQLSKRCDGSHQHQHLTGGRCKDAAFYPLPLVRSILKLSLIHI